MACCKKIRRSLCEPPNPLPQDASKLCCEPMVRFICVPNKPPRKPRCDANPCAPKDSLDLALSSCYDHHRQFNVPRVYARMQCETYRLFPWGRCQEKRWKMRQLQADPCFMDSCITCPTLMACEPSVKFLCPPLKDRRNNRGCCSIEESLGSSQSVEGSPMSVASCCTGTN